MTAALSPMASIAKEYHLSIYEAHSVECYLSDYTSSSIFYQLYSRTMNCFLALLGQSSWQQAGKVLRTACKNELRKEFFKKEAESSTVTSASDKEKVIRPAARNHADLILKYLVKCSIAHNLIQQNVIPLRSHLICKLFCPNIPGINIITKPQWTKSIVDVAFTKK